MMRANLSFEINEQVFKLVSAKLQMPHAKFNDCLVKPVLAVNDEAISGMLGEAVRRNKIRTQRFSLCLSRNLATVRNLHLPSQNKNEVAQMIELNVSRIVPYKKEKIVFGYQLLGTDDMGYTKVILAILKDDVVERQMKIVEKSGLFIDRIILSTYAVWQAVLQSQHSQINQTDFYLILDVDYNFTDFIIFSASNVLFTRSINVGADNIYGKNEQELTKLLGEVRQSLIMFYNEEINKKPALVFLSGSKVINDWAESIGRELDMPVKVVGSCLPDNCPIAQEGDAGSKSSLTAACELALRESSQCLSFVLPQIEIRKSLRENVRNLMIIGVSAVYIFMVICFIFIGAIHHNQRYLNRLKETNKKVIGELGGVWSDFNKIDMAKEYLSRRRLPLMALTTLQRVIPSGISISNIDINSKGEVILRGQAAQMSEVFKFISTLEKVEYFKEVKSRQTRKKKVKNKDITEFELFFTLSL